MGVGFDQRDAVVPRMGYDPVTMEGCGFVVNEGLIHKTLWDVNPKTGFIRIMDKSRFNKAEYRLADRDETAKILEKFRIAAQQQPEPGVLLPKESGTAAYFAHCILKPMLGL
jgi:hypothetical protein